MNTAWFFTNLAAAVLLPPLNLILAALAGFMLRKRWPRLGSLMCVGALLALAALSTGVGANLLVASLENRIAPLVSPRGSGAQAIVVLGGGRLPRAPEYAGQDVPSLPALGRLRYAARLHRDTGLPILLTGGSPDGAPESEAAVMARVLREDFGVTAKWLEQQSNNTAQNAQLSAAMLKQAGIGRVLLVTDAIHMPRALQVFSATALQPVPAPTTFMRRDSLSPIDFVPSAGALMRSHYAMHEWIGMAWYAIRHGK